MAETWTPVGKVTPTPKGAWSSSTSYARLDIVSNDGSSYIAIQGVPAGTAITNTTYWQKFAEKGDTGETGATGNGVASIVVTETSTSGSAHNYRMAITMTNGTVTNIDYTITDGAVTSVNGRTGAVTGLAEDNGYYEEMTVGTADQLASSIFVEDKVPYVFRTAGGSVDIGDRMYDTLVGGTIVWNQLLDNTKFTNSPFPSGGASTVTYDSTNDTTSYSATLNTTYGYAAKAYNVKYAVMGHVYFGCAKATNVTGATNLWVKPHAQSSNPKYVNIDNYSYSIQKIDATSATPMIALGVSAPSGTAVSATWSKAMMIDLTLMFGSTIANYLYNLEQTHAGDGIALLLKLFPAPYYPYNAGTLIHVNPTAHVTTGFNQWDEEWVNGYYTATGVWTVSQSIVASKNPIPVVGGATYHCSIGTDAPLYVTFWDEDAPIAGTSGEAHIIGERINVGDSDFTVPNGASYIHINAGSAYGDSYNHDICINLHWDGERDGEYEPYSRHTYALDDIVLRGLPKLDANNKLYYDGDTYASDGTVTRKYGIIDMGTIEWTNETSTQAGQFRAGFNYELESYPKGKFQGNVITVNYVNNPTHAWNNIQDRQIGIGNSAAVPIVRIRDERYSTVEQLQTALNGQYMVYELDTPVIETAEPFTSLQIVDNWGTEQYVMDAQNGVSMPVGHVSKYTVDLKAKLETAPDSPDGDGDYLVRQTDGTNAYVPIEYPVLPNGEYPEMTVGSAHQLLSNVFVEDSAPYNFRTSGGTADIGDRAFEDAVVGGTIAWNQLMSIGAFEKTGGTATTTADGVCTFTASAGGQQAYRTHMCTVNHKYFMSISYKTATATNDIKGRIFGGDIDGSATTNKQTIYKMGTVAITGNVSVGVIDRRTSNFDAITIYPPMVFDLTQMFGSAIADYIFSVYNSNPTNGITLAKAWGNITKPYYEYNAGTLIHVNASSHNTTGFNQWDEQWEAYGSVQIKAKNWIPVIAGATYYAKCDSNYGLSLYFKESLSDSTSISGWANNNTFVVPNNCHYMMIYTGLGYGATYKNDICINLHWDGERDGEYAPYEIHEYALDSSLTLRGVPKLTASNELYYDGDEYANDGTVTRKYGIIDLGSLTYRRDPIGNYGNYFFYINVANLTPKPKAFGAGMCHKYQNITSFNWNQENKTIGIGNSQASPAIYIRDDSYTDATAFKNSLNGVYFVYPILEPVTETAEPFQSPQIIDDFGTEEFVVEEQNGVAMPVGHNSRYASNLRAKLEMVPDSPDGNGDYIVRQTNGINEYVPLTERIPSAPSSNGSYVLKCTVSGSTVTYTWEAQS